MNEAEALDLGREAIFTLLKIGAPIMLVSLVVGVIVAIVQALTQIQEMTLTFVPKIVVMFFCINVAFAIHTQRVDRVYGQCRRPNSKH